MTDRSDDETLDRRTKARRSSAGDVGNLSLEEVQAVVNELDVHQSELELQNEELRTLSLDLQAARDRFRDLFDFAPISYLTVDPDGRIVEANLAAGELFACPRSELMRSRLQDFVSESDRDHFYLFHHSLLAEGKTDSLELEVRAGDGVIRHVAIESSLIARPDRHCRLTLLDVSDRVAAESELRRAKEMVEETVAKRTQELLSSRELTEKIAEAVPLGVWIYDFSSESLVYTNALTRLALGDEGGRAPEKIEISDLIDPMDLVKMSQLKEQLERDPRREFAKVTFRIRTSVSNEVRWLTSHITIFDRDAQGRLGRVLGVSTDVTKARAAEDRLNRLQQEALLARERERRDIASMLHDSIGQLLPLANTRLAIARRSCDAESQEQLLEVERLIREAHEVATSLTFRLNPPALREIGLVAGFQALSREMDRDHGLRVALEYSDESFPLSQAVEFAVYRVVHELLVNVAKHSGIKEARLSAMSNGSRLRVVVEDKGRGFVPLPGLSWGMGLRNAEERLSYLGCRFVVNSEPDQGTSVELLVPLLDSEISPEEDEE